VLIQKLSDIQGAKNAEGLVVVVDILRAATVEAYLFSIGVNYIIPVSTQEEAFSLKKHHPEYILVGENYGIKIKGFDYGNSPTELLKADLKNKVVIHRSTRGTQGLVTAVNANELIFGSFVTCSAIVAYAHKKKIKKVSIVAIDEEDSLFSDYLEKSLLGQKTNTAQVKEALYNHPNVKWYFDTQKEAFPKTDIDLALQINKFNFICLVKRINNMLITSKVIV